MAITPFIGTIHGKRTKRGILPLSDRVWKLIEAHFTLNDKLGIAARTIQDILKRVAQRAGISKPVSTHVLRHTFAVNCIKKGISTRALQQFLGHDSPITTEIYLSLSPGDAIREYREKW